MSKIKKAGNHVYLPHAPAGFGVELKIQLNLGTVIISSILAVCDIKLFKVLYNELLSSAIDVCRNPKNNKFIESAIAERCREGWNNWRDGEKQRKNFFLAKYGMPDTKTGEEFFKKFFSDTHSWDDSVLMDRAREP